MVGEWPGFSVKKQSNLCSLQVINQTWESVDGEDGEKKKEEKEQEMILMKTIRDLKVGRSQNRKEKIGERDQLAQKRR